MKYGMEELQQMMEVDIKTVDIDTLTDLRDIRIDTKKSVPEKLRQFASQTDNLFLHRVGDYVVKVSYSETGMDVNEKMKRYIARLAEISYM